VIKTETGGSVSDIVLSILVNLQLGDSYRGPSDIYRGDEPLLVYSFLRLDSYCFVISARQQVHKRASLGWVKNLPGL